MTLNDVLVWLVSGGGAVLVASWVLERMAWFQNLEPNAKEWTFFGISAGLAVAARAVQVYVPAEVLAQIAPWFELILAIFIAQFLGKAYHFVDKR